MGFVHGTEYCFGGELAYVGGVTGRLWEERWGWSRWRRRRWRRRRRGRRR
jgi:hypothetical protein